MSGKEFAKICRGAAQVLEALRKQALTAGSESPVFYLKTEPETLQALLAPINAIVEMKTV